MTFNNIGELKKEGFIGFKTVSELFDDNSILPNAKGGYLVLYIAHDRPLFLTTGSGGHFKHKDPNVSLTELRSNWVNNTIVVYIGKAASLKSRLMQYMKFGQGKNIGHYGGRYIWQLKNSQELVVCWKPLDVDPRLFERNLIEEFVSVFGERPFANLRD